MHGCTWTVPSLLHELSRVYHNCIAFLIVCARLHLCSVSSYSRDGPPFSVTATQNQTTADGGNATVAPPPSVHVVNPLDEEDFFNIASLTSVEELFASRVHLGHKAGTWNPLMKDYIYGTRAGVHIIDLEQTWRHLHLALNVAAHIAYRNGIILFVNERSPFERITQEAARECGAYFVVQKWRAGTLTNSYKLLSTLRLPDLVVFFSVPPSKTAIKEAAMCNIPAVGVLDTDCTPNLITYPVPGNDDSPAAVQLYLRLFRDAINIAKRKRTEDDKATTAEGNEPSGTAGISYSPSTNTAAIASPDRQSI